MIYLVGKARQRHTLARLEAAIEEGERALASLKAGAPERAELIARLDLMRKARAGQVPMTSPAADPGAMSILPSLGLLVALAVV